MSVSDVLPISPRTQRLRGVQLLLPLAVAGLLFLAVVLGALHHHEDLTHHPECAICAVLHHAPAVTVTPPTLVAITLSEMSTLIAAPLLAVILTRPNRSLRSRAPPR